MPPASPATEQIVLLNIYPRNAMTLGTFLERNALSRSHYYKLKKSDLGPTEMRLGRLILISFREERRWTKRMERGEAAHIETPINGGR